MRGGHSCQVRGPCQYSWEICTCKLFPRSGRLIFCSLRINVHDHNSQNILELVSELPAQGGLNFHLKSNQRCEVVEHVLLECDMRNAVGYQGCSRRRVGGLCFSLVGIHHLWSCKCGGQYDGDYPGLETSSTGYRGRLPSYYLGEGASRIRVSRIALRVWRVRTVCETKILRTGKHTSTVRVSSISSIWYNTVKC